MTTVYSEAELNEVLQEVGSSLVVVDFYALWCGPCKMIGPKIDEAAASNQDVVFVKVEIDEVEELTVRYQVHQVPTFVFIKNGKKLDTLVGADINSLLNKIKLYK